MFPINHDHHTVNIIQQVYSSVFSFSVVAVPHNLMPVTGMLSIHTC